jgi:hypothetical protein
MVIDFLIRGFIFMCVHFFLPCVDPVMWVPLVAANDYLLVLHPSLSYLYFHIFIFENAQVVADAEVFVPSV